ncbi:MAG: orotate phosphoribosyltransferase [Thermoplasmata archaeon]|nr:orotate phosphoribosyltransferase [Thermoplasmata archaeon]
MFETGALKFGRFKLKSGRISEYYVDVKVASTKPEFLKEVSNRISDMPLHYDRIAGLELGSVPLAVALSLRVGLPFIIIRKERKEYGTGGRFVGEFEKGEKILIIEDVITTGGTTLSGISALREAGGVVEDVVVVVDREEGGKDTLESAGVEVHSLLKASDLLRYKGEGGEN